MVIRAESVSEWLKRRERGTERMREFLSELQSSPCLAECQQIPGGDSVESLRSLVVRPVFTRHKKSPLWRRTDMDILLRSEFFHGLNKSRQITDGNGIPMRKRWLAFIISSNIVYIVCCIFIFCIASGSISMAIDVGRKNQFDYCKIHTQWLLTNENTIILNEATYIALFWTGPVCFFYGWLICLICLSGCLESVWPGIGMDFLEFHLCLDVTDTPVHHRQIMKTRNY